MDVDGELAFLLVDQLRASKSTCRITDRRAFGSILFLDVDQKQESLRLYAVEPYLDSSDPTIATQLIAIDPKYLTNEPVVSMSPGWGFGLTASAGAGDYDGDGIEEIIAVAPLDGPVGSLCVVSPTTGRVLRRHLYGGPGPMLAPEGGFGGSPRRVLVLSQSKSGVAASIFMPADGSVERHAIVSTNDLWVYSVDSTQDLNGDSVRDFVMVLTDGVDVSLSTDPIFASSARSEVVFLDGGSLSVFDRIVFSVANSEFGLSIAPFADTDGDEVMDCLIGTVPLMDGHIARHPRRGMALVRRSLDGVVVPLLDGDDELAAAVVVRAQPIPESDEAWVVAVSDPFHPNSNGSRGRVGVFRLERNLK